jgi:hypothetical protein
MQITLRAVFDEENRKQVVDAVLGEARKIARETIDAAIRAEVLRISKVVEERFTKTQQLSKFITDALQRVLTERWLEIRSRIDEHVALAADEVVAKKMASKTVWEAESQDAYVRQVVAQELKKILKSAL